MAVLEGLVEQAAAVYDDVTNFLPFLIFFLKFHYPFSLAWSY